MYGRSYEESTTLTEAKLAAFLSLSPEIGDFITWNDVVKGYKMMKIWHSSKRMEYTKKVRAAANSDRQSTPNKV